METIAQKINTYKNLIKTHEIFDINLWWDPLFCEGFRVYDNWETGWETYFRFGLKRGLVSSAKAARFDAIEGNVELAKLIDGKSLYGCMVLLPELFYSNDGEKYVDGLIDQGFIAARLFPKTYMHSMNPDDLFDLYKTLETRKLPLLLWHTQVSFDEIDRICKVFPALNIIVEGHDRKLLYHARQYMPLLMRHKNFYIETHGLLLYREFEHINKLVGCQNLLYGSCFPYNTPDHSLYHVFTAEIFDDQRSGILYDNAKRMFYGRISL